MSNVQPLSDYWEIHKIQDGDPLSAGVLDSPLDASKMELPQSNRGSSDATVTIPPESSSRQSLAPFHPASSLCSFIESFGPLIFPLYRAALLRKRILMVTEAPVHLPCDYGETSLAFLGTQSTF